jgi:hypothetical protein
MVVCPTLEAAKNYLIFRYADTSRESPLIKSTGPEDIGDICFVTGEKELFASIDFIRLNVIIMMRADGSIRKVIPDIARELDKSLKNKEPVDDYKNLYEFPDVRLTCKTKKIKVGESVPLQMEIKNPENRDLCYFWEMSGGGVERDGNKNWLYYASEEGKHKIKVTVVNEFNLLFDSNSIEINVIHKNSQ